MSSNVLLVYGDGKVVLCNGDRFKLGMQGWDLVKAWEVARLGTLHAMEEKGEDSVDFWRRMIDFEEIGQVLMETRRALRDN